MKIIIIGAASHGKGAIKQLLEGLDQLDYPLQVEIENLTYAHLSLPEAGFTLKPGSTSPAEFKSFAVLSRSLSSLSAIAYMNRNEALAKVCIEAAEGDEELAARIALEDEAAEAAATDKAEKEKAKAEKAKADSDAKAKAAEEAAAAKAASEAGDNKAEGSEPAAKAAE